MSQYTELRDIEHIRTYFCHILHMVLHSFCHILHIFLHILHIFLHILHIETNRSVPVSAMQCHAEPESGRVEALMCFCNPQEAGSGSIRGAAARSSVTGDQCWSSCTGRDCCRASIGALLTKHIILPSIHD